MSNPKSGMKKTEFRIQESEVSIQNKDASAVPVDRGFSPDMKIPGRSRPAAGTYLSGL
jgi:hypothetical protein